MEKLVQWRGHTVASLIEELKQLPSDDLVVIDDGTSQPGDEPRKPLKFDTIVSVTAKVVEIKQSETPGERDQYLECVERNYDEAKTPKKVRVIYLSIDR